MKMAVLTWRDVAVKDKCREKLMAATGQRCDKPRPSYSYVTCRQRTVNRNCLTRSEHIQLLSTPKGYTWTGVRGLKFIRKRCKKIPWNSRRFDSKPKENFDDTSTAWKRFVTTFLLIAEDSLTQPIKIMLTKILVSKVNFTDPKWSNHRNTKTELCHFFQDLNPDCSSSQSRQDSTKILSSLIFNYIVQVLCSDSIMKKNNLTRMVLKIIKETSQEYVLTSTDHLFEEIQIFIANMLSPWLITSIAGICQNNGNSENKKSSKNSNQTKTVSSKKKKTNQKSKKSKLTKSKNDNLIKFKKNKLTISKQNRKAKSDNDELIKSEKDKLTEAEKDNLTRSKADMLTKSEKNELSPKTIYGYVSNDKIDHQVGKKSVETKKNDKELNKSKSTTHEGNKIPEPSKAIDSKFDDKNENKMVELVKENEIMKKGADGKSIDGNLKRSSDEKISEQKNTVENNNNSSNEKSETSKNQPVVNVQENNNNAVDIVHKNNANTTTSVADSNANDPTLNLKDNEKMIEKISNTSGIKILTSKEQTTMNQETNVLAKTSKSESSQLIELEDKANRDDEIMINRTPSTEINRLSKITNQVIGYKNTTDSMSSTYTTENTKTHHKGNKETLTSKNDLNILYRRKSDKNKDKPTAGQQFRSLNNILHCKLTSLETSENYIDDAQSTNDRLNGADYQTNCFQSFADRVCITNQQLGQGLLGLGFLSRRRTRMFDEIDY